MKRAFLLMLITFALTLGWPQSASAHPLGNFTTNQYSRLVIGKKAIQISYIIDQAEIPTFQERQQIDINKDGTIDAQEQAQHMKRMLPELLDGLSLSVDEQSVPLQLVEYRLDFPAGQGGLATMRLELELEVQLSAGSTQHRLQYANSNYAERLGWREIIAQASDGTVLIDSSVPATDQSNALTRYPENMLEQPPNMREAHMSFTVAMGTVESSKRATTASISTSKEKDALTEILSGGELSITAFGVALVLAFLLGAGHALTPGHGKTIVAAYLVGTRGTARHALILGLTTTMTHTAGVFLLGIVTLSLSQYILPEQIFPWLELISGLMIVMIGLRLAYTRARYALAHARAAVGQKEGAVEHDHAHHHHHDHDHHDHDHHSHDHEHGDHGHHHHHGPGGHSHSNDYRLADWMTGQGRSSWRDVLALGISGGLLPCPSALVVLLSAIAIGRVGFGLLLIVAFSLGLAAVLTGIGIALVYARGLFDRLPRSGLLLKLLPVASACIVMLAGLAISMTALRQIY